MYNMPMPTPNMPMQQKKSISCQSGGIGIFSQIIAWMSTLIAETEATEAAMVCM